MHFAPHRAGPSPTPSHLGSATALRTLGDPAALATAALLPARLALTAVAAATSGALLRRRLLGLLRFEQQLQLGGVKGEPSGRPLLRLLLV